MNKINLETFKSFRGVYWPSDPLIERLKQQDAVDLDELSPEELKTLVKTLDKRFAQLWDKVIYERDKGYVQYPHHKKRVD